MASRRLADLTHGVNEKALDFLTIAEKRGSDVLIYCTWRSFEEQARLYRQGRSLAAIQNKATELRERYFRPDLAKILMAVGPQHGNKVTNAGPGQSLHNYRRAFDGCPIIGGKPVWGHETPEEKALWSGYGEMIEACGLEWGGRWTGLIDLPHAQEPGANWRDLIRDPA